MKKTLKIVLVVAILVGVAWYLGLFSGFNFNQKEKAIITPRMVNHPDLGSILTGGRVEGWMDGHYAAEWSAAMAGEFALSVGRDHTFEMKIWTPDGTLYWSAKGTFYVPEYTAGQNYDLAVDWNTKAMHIVKSVGG